MVKRERVIEERERAKLKKREIWLKAREIET